MSLKLKIYKSVAKRAQSRGVECDSKFDENVNSLIDVLMEQENFQMLSDSETTSEQGLGITDAVERGIVEGAAEGIAYSVIPDYSNK